MRGLFKHQRTSSVLDLACWGGLHLTIIPNDNCIFEKLIDSLKVSTLSYNLV